VAEFLELQVSVPNHLELAERVAKDADSIGNAWNKRARIGPDIFEDDIYQETQNVILSEISSSVTPNVSPVPIAVQMASSSGRTGDSSMTLNKPRRGKRLLIGGNATSQILVKN
jgi:hypothetical protein